MHEEVTLLCITTNDDAQDQHLGAKPGCCTGKASFVRAWAAARTSYEHLQLPAFAKQQCPVPLLLGHQVVHQPDLRQTGQIREPIKLCDLSDPVGAEVQKLKASQAGQVS